jgi:hypothetical protein
VIAYHPSEIVGGRAFYRFFSNLDHTSAAGTFGSDAAGGSEGVPPFDGDGGIRHRVVCDPLKGKPFSPQKPGVGKRKDGGLIKLRDEFRQLTRLSAEADGISLSFSKSGNLGRKAMQSDQLLAAGRPRSVPKYRWRSARCRGLGDHVCEYIGSAL